MGRTVQESGAAPPDRFLSIGELTSQPSQPNVEIASVYDGIDLFLIRFLVRARAGQTLAALDDLEVALAAIRHTGHRCGRYYVNGFLDANRRALFLADSMFDRAVSDGAFRGGLIEILARHDEAWPDFAGIVKSDYFAQAYPWARIWGGSTESRTVQLALVDAPWEAMRFEGLRQRIYATLLAEAEIKRFPVRSEPAKVFEEYFGRPPIWGRSTKQEQWNSSHLYSSPIGYELTPILHALASYSANVSEIRAPPRFGGRRLRGRAGPADRILKRPRSAVFQASPPKPLSWRCVPTAHFEGARKCLCVLWSTFAESRDHSRSNRDLRHHQSWIHFRRSDGDQEVTIVRPGRAGSVSDRRREHPNIIIA